MNVLVQDKRHDLERICRARGVARMELFGSATRADFDPEHSDLDFLVTFLQLGEDEYADAYFGLLEDLQALFGRHIDLVVEPAIQNPYFRQAVENTRVLLYAAWVEEISLRYCASGGAGGRFREAVTFPYGFFKNWLFDTNVGKFVRS